MSEVGSSASALSREEEEKWKKEYDAQTESWKVESAVARQKAEQERARWEALRAEELEKTKSLTAAVGIGASSGLGASGMSWERLDDGTANIRGPPNPHFNPRETGYPGSPSPADVRDSVSGEPSGHSNVTSEVSKVRT